MLLSLRLLDWAHGDAVLAAHDGGDRRARLRRRAAEAAADVESALERLVSEDWPWRHTEEGDRNPWSHVRSALTASSLTIPIVDGDIALGDR